MKRAITTQTQTNTNLKYTLANVNLRETRSLEGKVLAVIPANTPIQILDSAEDWDKVLYNDQIGYVYIENLSKTKYTWRRALLRTYATAESNPSAVVEAKTRVQVLDTVGDWSYVAYGNRKGYIFSYFLTDDGNSPETYDFTYFTTDMLRFVNDNDIKSPTVNLITTDLTNRLTYVFQKNRFNRWEQLYRWECTVGAPNTPTIQGTFYISGRKPYFGSDTYRVKYATRIKDSYYYHTVLFNPEGTEIIDDRLGLAISHGCIRLAVPNAQWIYDNILDATAVVIH